MESKVANITGFIDEIQSNLSDKAYASFKTALAQYKKASIVSLHSYLIVAVTTIVLMCDTYFLFQKHDIYAFTESLKDIFKQPSLYHLLQG